ncbi:MAG: hypothetical protein VYE76_01570, partial [Pseudomonadota bacterium]|nr:hypothetical protein [Pseudomonadota bacterium]
VADREQLSISFTATDLVTVAVSSNGLVNLGGFLTLGSPVQLPGADIDLPEARLTSTAYTETWEYWQPGDVLDRSGNIAEFSVASGIAYRPIMESQNDSSDNPTISWTPVRDRINGYSDLTTLRLKTSQASAGYQTAWAIHLPAGESTVTLPSLPSGMTDTMLPDSQYALMLETTAFIDMDYDEVMGTVDINDIDYSIATERMRTSSLEANAPKLMR